MELPSYVDELFLDLGGATLDTHKHSRMIIERIMKLGDLRAIAWMFRVYGRSEITRVAPTCRELTRRDVNFWANVLSIPREEFRWISRY